MMAILSQGIWDNEYIRISIGRSSSMIMTHLDFISISIIGRIQWGCCFFINIPNHVILQMTYSNVVCWLKKFTFPVKVYYGMSKETCSQYINIGSVCGLLPNWWQAIYYLQHWWHSFMAAYGITRPQWVNSSLPNAAYMHLWIGWTLVQTMACCLFGAKPLSKHTLGYCQLDPLELQWNFN